MTLCFASGLVLQVYSVDYLQDGKPYSVNGEFTLPTVATSDHIQAWSTLSNK